MTKTQIASAVRQACKQVHENSTEKKITKALEILGVDSEKAHNYGLAFFDAKSISGPVVKFFGQ